MNPIENFKNEVAENIRKLGEDKDVQSLSRIWSRVTNQHGYTYNFRAPRKTPDHVRFW